MTHRPHAGWYCPNTGYPPNYFGADIDLVPVPEVVWDVLTRWLPGVRIEDVVAERPWLMPEPALDDLYASTRPPAGFTRAMYGEMIRRWVVNGIEPYPAYERSKYTWDGKYDYTRHVVAYMAEPSIAVAIGRCVFGEMPFQMYGVWLTRDPDAFFTATPVSVSNVMISNRVVDNQ